MLRVGAVQMSNAPVAIRFIARNDRPLRDIHRRTRDCSQNITKLLRDWIVAITTAASVAFSFAKDAVFQRERDQDRAGQDVDRPDRIVVQSEIVPEGLRHVAAATE